MTPEVAGVIFADCVTFVLCRHCGAHPGIRCYTPRGIKTPKPHVVRVKYFTTNFPDKVRTFTAVRGDEFIRRLGQQ